MKTSIGEFPQAAAQAGVPVSWSPSQEEQGGTAPRYEGASSSRDTRATHARLHAVPYSRSSGA